MRRDSFRYETWLIHAWDRTHSYMRHDSFTYETWLIHIRDMTHSYMRHDSFKWDADESCLMCECVISYIYQWVMSHVWMSHVSYMNGSCLIYEWVMPHIWMGHASQVSSILDADECDMTHSHMRHDSFIYETWLIRMRRGWVWHDSFTYETWLIHVWDMTHSYMRHDSFIWDADECDMTHFIWDAHQRDPPHRASGFAKTRTGGQRYIGCLLSDSPSCLSMFLSKFASGSIQSPNQMLCWGISVLASHSEIPNFENKLIKFPARIQLGYTRELGYTPTVHIYSKWNTKPWLNV